MEAKEPKFISLEQYKMDGNFIESNNKTYTLFWDFDSRCVLFFKDKKIVYDLRNLFFVSVSDIANDGSVIIAGAYEKTDEKNGIIICNSKGEKQIFKYIDSRIVNVAISENGETAVFQTYNSMISEEYDNKLFIIDVINKKICSCFHCPLGWADGYQFFDNKIRLYFGKNYIDYSFTGECLEKEKLPTVKENPFDSFYDLESKYGLISEKSNKTDIEKFYQKYLQLSKEKMSPYIYGCIFRRLGELALLLGNKKEALLYFEKATEIYPGIGVKKRITALKKELC